MENTKTKVAYTKGHNMNDELKSDDIVLHATNLLTDETYHWIYPKSKIEELDKVDLSTQAHSIAKLMEVLSKLNGQEEVDFGHAIGYEVAKYINSSKSYELGSQTVGGGQNAYYVAVEYLPTGDTCCRILGAANVKNVAESTSSGLMQAISMSKMMGHVKVHSSGKRYTIMLDKLTRGTRVSGPGSNMTPKKKKRKKRK